MVQPPRSDSQPARAQPVISPRWQVQLADQTVFGPITGDELKDLVRQKIVTADCQLQREGKNEWLMPSQVFPKSFPVSARPPAPMPPPPPPPPVAATAPPMFGAVVQSAVPVLPVGTPIAMPPAAQPLIVPEIASPPTVAPVVSVTDNSSPRRSPQEFAGMAMVVIPAALVLLAIFGLIYTFAQQQGWEPNRVNPGVSKFFARAGFALLCALAGLGALLGKSLFGDGAGGRRPQ